MTTKTKTRLHTIATSMRNTLEATDASWLHRRLDNGLEVVLQRKVEPTGAVLWRLALGRTTAPSADEIEECRDAFAVPVAAEVEKSSKPRTNPKTNHTATWHIAEASWYEAQ